MINKIFWDIDETLIHTTTSTFALKKAKHISFKLKNDRYDYGTIIRESAQQVIDYTREVVGFDNVYILTAATAEYANKINELAGWGFHENNIIAREIIAQHALSYEYKDENYCNNLANENNVLIDNLRYRDNYDKTNLIGIDEDRYLKVFDFYGAEYEKEDFPSIVRAFIEKLK